MLPMLLLGGKSSKYRCVSWNNHMQKWVAYFRLDGKRFTLGSHATELAAAQAFDQEAKKYKRKKKLNFRESSSSV